MSNENVIIKIIDIQESPQKDYLKQVDHEYGKAFYLKPIIYLAIGVGLLVAAEFFVYQAYPLQILLNQYNNDIFLNLPLPNIDAGEVIMLIEWYTCGAICFLIGGIASIYYGVKHLFRD